MFVKLYCTVFVSAAILPNCGNTLKPLVINTWNFINATIRAWEYAQNWESSIQTLEVGLAVCQDLQCDHTVGYGGSPDENGESTLDALIFDGLTMNMGAVGGLRNIKNAVAVARHVLENTEHSFLVGSLATQFAVEMGFKKEDISSDFSQNEYRDWLNKNCQPNFWTNVEPDPQSTCGPYKPLSENSIDYKLDEVKKKSKKSEFSEKNHDTIGMIVIDINGHIAAGTSTNGANHKIPGRVGDSPIPGAGAYADNDVGAAVATGDGDVMMRFLPSFLAVEEMRRGSSPTVAARMAIDRITAKFSNFFGAIIAVNKNGEYGAACNGMTAFPYAVANSENNPPVIKSVDCF